MNTLRTARSTVDDLTRSFKRFDSRAFIGNICTPTLSNGFRQPTHFFKHPTPKPGKRATPMSADNAQAAAASKENSQSVQLFQRAHQKMVMLQRVEDQMQQLLNQRRSIQDELRGIQVQINEEFDRLLRASAAAAGAAGAGGSSGSSSPVSTSNRPFVDISEDSGRRPAIRESDAVALAD